MEDDDWEQLVDAPVVLGGGTAAAAPAASKPQWDDEEEDDDDDQKPVTKTPAPRNLEKQVKQIA